MTGGGNLPFSEDHSLAGRAHSTQQGPTLSLEHCSYIYPDSTYTSLLITSFIPSPARKPEIECVHGMTGMEAKTSAIRSLYFISRDFFPAYIPLNISLGGQPKEPFAWPATCPFSSLVFPFSIPAGSLHSSVCSLKLTTLSPSITPAHLFLSSLVNSLD